MNTIQLIGRWTKDHDLKYLQDGKAVLNNTIAVNRRFDKEKADFLRVVIFGKAAESTANYTNKGSQVAIVGRVQTGSYEGQDGKMIYTTDVIVDQVQFLDSKKDNQQNNKQNQSQNQNTGGYGQSNTNTPNYQNNAQNYQNQTNNDPFSGGQQIDINEDDLPF